MEKTASNRGIRRIYHIVSLCFLVVTAWLYWNEGPYVKAMDIEITPERGRVQAEILADGKNASVYAGDGQVKLFVDRRYEGEKLHLMIYGECREERTEPVSIRVVSDSGDGRSVWNCQGLAGTVNGNVRFTAGENRGRKLYLLLSVLTVIVTGFMWFGREKNKLQKELEIYGNKIIEKLWQEPGMEKACGEGRRLFAFYQGQKTAFILLAAWLWLFLAFWVIHGASHGTLVFYRPYRVLLALAGGAAIKYLGIMRWGRLTREILLKDCRPVTAAVAYLLMGTYGIEGEWSRFLLYHNGASGLYRSGHCKEALDISDMAWGMLKKKPRDYIAYVHSSLKYQCLKVLDETEAAGEEKRKMDALGQKNGGWMKRKGIQRFLGIQDICRRIETGEIEQAEKSAGKMLGQWKEGYYRLPVLGLMAELKEFLGKEDEAAKLREEILTFSPENKEVRQVMGQGRLSYRHKKARVWDGGLLAVYVLCAAGIGACILTM